MITVLTLLIGALLGAALVGLVLTRRLRTERDRVADRDHELDRARSERDGAERTHAAAIAGLREELAAQGERHRRELERAEEHSERNVATLRARLAGLGTPLGRLGDELASAVASYNAAAEQLDAPLPAVGPPTGRFRSAGDLDGGPTRGGQAPPADESSTVALPAGPPVDFSPSPEDATVVLPGRGRAGR